MNRTRRLAAFAAGPVLLFAVAACSPEAETDDAKGKPSASSSGSNGGGLRLSDAVSRLKTVAESRTGYERDKFHLWIDADHDGCDTRREVLVAEAVKKPRQGEDCKLTGGSWRSYYDDKTVTDARKLDIDHVVPLAEAWDSGASSWSVERRESYANDVDAERSLVAVSLGPNRTKGDKDPAEWMPPAKDATCVYLADWVGTKLRWSLTVDSDERSKLRELASACAETAVDYEPA
ncbi:HNH endonuclease family protein [Streptomyces sp. NPDC017993]|uniref:HNH endonuclease family protein n=1 Tax=Streptomyces sp. NPDC017993 TaxID=3365027 RepID=UPI0037B921A6